MVSWEVAKYMDNVLSGIELDNIGSFWRAVFRCFNACSASSFHLKLLLSTHTSTVWNNGMDFSADFGMKRPSAVIYPFNPYISFILLGGLVSRRSFTLIGFGCIPFLVI